MEKTNAVINWISNNHLDLALRYGLNNYNNDIIILDDLNHCALITISNKGIKLVDLLDKLYQKATTRFGGSGLDLDIESQLDWIDLEWQKCL